MSVYAEKRRNRKTGKIEPTGRWVAEVSKSHRRLRGAYATFEEAQTKEEEFNSRLDAGDPGEGPVRDRPDAKPQTVSQLIDRATPYLWLDRYGNKTEWGEYAVSNLERVKDWIGNTRLANLSDVEFGTIADELRKAGRSPGTINRYYSSIMPVFKWGAGKKYLTPPECPWQDEDEGRIRWLTPEEEGTLDNLLRSYGRDEEADFMTVAIDTGLRRGENLRVQPKDVDAMGNRAFWLRVWKTKNKVARSIALTARSRDILQKRLPWKCTETTLQYWFTKARKDMGLINDEDFCIHALRHTCASRMVAANVNLRVIQRHMGHKRIETTLRYAQVSDDLLAEAVEKLTARFGLDGNVGGAHVRGNRSPHTAESAQ